VCDGYNVGLFHDSVAFPAGHLYILYKIVLQCYEKCRSKSSPVAKSDGGNVPLVKNLKHE